MFCTPNRKKKLKNAISYKGVFFFLVTYSIYIVHKAFLLKSVQRFKRLVEQFYVIEKLYINKYIGYKSRGNFNI